MIIHISEIELRICGSKFEFQHLKRAQYHSIMMNFIAPNTDTGNQE